MGSFSGSLPKSTSGSPTSVPDTPLRFGSGAPNLGCPKLRSPNPSPPLEGPPGTGPGTEVPGKGPKGRPAYSGLGVQKWGFGDPPFGHLGRPPWGLVWGPWPKPRFPDPPWGGSGNLTFPGLDGPKAPWPGTVQTCPNRPKVHFLRFPYHPP